MSPGITKSGKVGRLCSKKQNKKKKKKKLEQFVDCQHSGCNNFGWIRIWGSLYLSTSLDTRKHHKSVTVYCTVPSE